jgi:hypothetical protein
MSSTPPTSPQRHQAAARQAERDSRVMGSPEQRRIPAAPSTSAAPPPGPSSARTPTTVDGQTYHHLPQSLAALAAAVSAIPLAPQRRGRGRTPAASAIALPPVSFILFSLINKPYNPFRLFTVPILLHLPQMQVLWLFLLLLSLLLGFLFYHLKILYLL